MQHTCKMHIVWKHFFDSLSSFIYKINQMLIYSTIFEIIHTLPLQLQCKKFQHYNGTMINTFSSGQELRIMLICTMKDLQHNQNDSRICKRDESAKRQIVKINDICYLSNSFISGNSFEQKSIIGIKCIETSSQAFIKDYFIFCWSFFPS